MIKIENSVTRRQKNFWSGCLFHPTDAIEDSWGKRILDRIAKDKAIKSVRVYAMLEDIVYLGEEGELKYDFRVSDTRLSYLVENGYDLVISYSGIPDCISQSTEFKTSVSKGKVRYKGKMWNTMPPKDYSLWEEICYEYTKHNIEKFGIETVSRWYLHCFNEPDVRSFFCYNIPKTETDARATEYCKLYEAFATGVLRASESLKIGGPALSHIAEFLRKFLEYVKEKNLRLDYIAIHNYAGTDPELISSGERRFDVENHIGKYNVYLDVIKSVGFSDREIVVDEWGMSAYGYYNIEECPQFIARENEVFSAYYAKLIKRLIEVAPNLSKLMICLSGQHEMTEDFSGFRNFFTLNDFAKPIYNAHLMASRLCDKLLSCKTENENLAVVPTKNERGEYSVLISYSSQNFEEDIPEYTEAVCFDENLAGKNLKVYCIDKSTTNPYRLAMKMGVRFPNDEEKKILREEGRLKPISDIEYNGKPVEIKLTPNSTYLIQVV